MSTNKRRLGQRIKAARAEKGWKQKHLAAEVAVEPITVSRWERGATSPDLDVLRQVAEAMGKPVSYFVAGEEQTAPTPGLDEAVRRMEAAAERIEASVEEIQALLAETRRSGSS